MLIVTSPFAGRAVGDAITDAHEVDAVLASENSNHVVVADDPPEAEPQPDAPAAPAPELAPPAPEEPVAPAPEPAPTVVPADEDLRP